MICRLFALSLFLQWSIAWGDSILIESESFDDAGGWVTDTQFIEIMGSPYLMAHGLGTPVKDASTAFTLSTPGKYTLYARTKNWVGPWKAKGEPGAFNIAINNKIVGKNLGCQGADWFWERAGEIELKAGKHVVSLKDLKGFNARCDAIYLTSEKNDIPDNASSVLNTWRSKKLGLPSEVEEKSYDLVVVGGGYAGICTSLAAARLGVNVALIQNRPVLGGNGSSEVQVWSQGKFRQRKYPFDEIIREFKDYARHSPGTIAEYGDDKKLAVVKAEKNIDLFLGHHAYSLKMKNDSSIESIMVLNVKRGNVLCFKAPLFCDSTGHGFIAKWSGADGYLEPKGRLGMSNLWAWENGNEKSVFPKTPWALPLTHIDFPYPRNYRAEWFWESGYDKHPYEDLELIRDWNLRANFGAWNAIKNKGAYAYRDKWRSKHTHAKLRWMAYIGGARETKQYFGDVIVTKENILNNKQFDDGCVVATWSIDLHYPNERFLKNYKHNPFISRAVHGKGVPEKGFEFPYRCFYSRNVENLFIACRAVSVTHEALGTIRVMNTLGMVGVAVGRASAIATKYGCLPRDVYAKHLTEMKGLWVKPGKYRQKMDASLQISTLP